MSTYNYKCKNCGILEISHSILDDALDICPYCAKSGLERLLSCSNGIIIKGKQPNQYNDCKGVKYWRDKNGVRHKVTASDGHSKAPTVIKQIKSAEEVESIKKTASKLASKKRSKDSYKRFRSEVKKKHGI